MHHLSTVTLQKNTRNQAAKQKSESKTPRMCKPHQIPKKHQTHHRWYYYYSYSMEPIKRNLRKPILKVFLTRLSLLYQVPHFALFLATANKSTPCELLILTFSAKKNIIADISVWIGLADCYLSADWFSLLLNY